MSNDKMNAVDTVRKMLFSMRDVKFRDFHARLIPSVSKELIIGVRTPDLRKYSHTLSDRDTLEFLEALPHQYYDENNLHGFLIENISDRDTCIAKLEHFLPFIDNWATCDMVRPKVFKRCPPDPTLISRWLLSEHTYTVRYGIGMLISYYMHDRFNTSQLKKVAALHSDEYYINIMISWYFATAMTWQYEAAIPFIEQHLLDTWVHNKAIQKAVESRLITDEHKKYLRSLKNK